MARFLMTLLGSSKQNCDWHINIIRSLLVSIRESQSLLTFRRHLKDDPQILSWLRACIVRAIPRPAAVQCFGIALTNYILAAIKCISGAY